MDLYAFELGRKKELCLAELKVVLGEKNLFEHNLDTAIFRLGNLDAQKLQDRLGGTIKIVKIFASSPKPNLESIIKEHLENNFKDHSGKIVFALSTLSFKNPRDINIKQLLNFSKKILKSLGSNSRFVNKNFQNTKPSTIYKARVLEKGIDLNIIKGNKEIFIGETVSIQNIDDYSKRDYDKPKRDAENGMMPPKLAQIMINLAGDSKTIFDPFCGTGTTLIEGLLMGKDVVGSDISEQMVSYSKENLEWTNSNFKTKNSHRVFSKDARFLTPKDLPEKISAVITEGYLGKPHLKLPDKIEREKIFRELANLHLNWLAAVHKITPNSCPVVMCITAFKIGKSFEFLPRFPELAKTAGYKTTSSFIYDRPDQIVAREIVILEKI